MFSCRKNHLTYHFQTLTQTLTHTILQTHICQSTQGMCLWEAKRDIIIVCGTNSTILLLCEFDSMYA